VILASQISNFSTWSNLTILLLWIVVIFLVYYIKLSSREVRFLFAGRYLSLSPVFLLSVEVVSSVSSLISSFNLAMIVLNS
jgi:hypothetical protein